MSCQCTYFPPVHGETAPQFLEEDTAAAAAEPTIFGNTKELNFIESTLEVLNDPDNGMVTEAKGRDYLCHEVKLELLNKDAICIATANPC